MSASLVGSEMCIRDRSAKTHGASQNHGLPNRTAEGRRGPGPPASRCRLICLLYTSDAADDM
eukprot:15420749-Alexandrium_andersonii.AAC.1